MNNLDEVKKTYAGLMSKYTTQKEKKNLLESTKEMIENRLKGIEKSPSLGGVDKKKLNGGEKGTTCNSEIKPKVKNRKYKVTCKKLKLKTEKVNKLSLKLQAEKRKMDYYEQEVAESKLLWNVLKSQIAELGSQLSSEVFNVYKEAGSRLKRESNLSIEMYNF